MSQRRQFVARRLVTQLGLVAECKQRFAATCRPSGARDVQNLIGGHETAHARNRRRRESAVVAYVAAQVRQGNEHFARVGNRIAMCDVPPCSCGVHEGG